MSNDHYVPQSFLRAWAFDGGRNKVYRYKLIPARRAVEFKDVSIRSIASSEDLYSINDGLNQVSFEQSIMNKALDQQLSSVVERLRESALSDLTDEERDRIGRLVLTLEARNPATLKMMILSEEDIDRIIDDMTGPVSPQSRDAARDLLRSMRQSTGALAAGTYSSWGYGPDLQALKGKRWLEVSIVDGVHQLVTSNYPTLLGATVPYGDDRHISSLAISPVKAIFISNPSVVEEFKAIDAETQFRYINLLTIAGASEAYTAQPNADPWIERHLGWATKISPENRAHYFSSALGE